MDLQTLENKAANCSACGLYAGRINPVFAKGNPKAKVMVCGMCPADEENKAGSPFVGRAGKLLDQILEASDFSLDDVYITNLVKCYLAAGKKLDQSWIDACFSYLLIQINIINPLVIITLGADASNTLLSRDSGSPLGIIRGKFFQYNKGTLLVPTYHPSFLLRKGGFNSQFTEMVVEDFRNVRRKF